MNILETVAASVKEALSNIGVHIRDSALVGSLYIKGALQDNSDVDFLVLVPWPTDVDALFLNEEGWTYGGSTSGANSKWASWTKYLSVKEVHDGYRGFKANLLVTNDAEYFEKWVTAAKACKFLHDSGVLLTRGQVHGVHEVIMDGAEPEAQVELRRY